MIKIIAVGKLKEEYLKEAVKEYEKRLSKYTKLEIIEVNDSKIDEEKKALEEEKTEILKHITGKEYIITLEINGKELSSVEFAKKIDETLMINSDITFIEGGSYGMHEDIRNKSNYSLSFSKMTFPHQLFRVFLLEQLFRAFKIANGETYHH